MRIYNVVLMAESVCIRNSVGAFVCVYDCSLMFFRQSMYDVCKYIPMSVCECVRVWGALYEECLLITSAED